MESFISIEFGRLLRANNTGFVAGCQISQLNIPSLGSLVMVPQENEYKIYGLIYEIQIDDDGLIRQLITAEDVDENIIADNRINRNVPLEISVLSVGFSLDGKISHLLPPRPPLSLDLIYQCGESDIIEFTNFGNFGYFRHILGSADLPIGDLIAAHIAQSQNAHAKNGDDNWINRATQELIILLRDDHQTLMSVLGALGDI